MTCKTIAGGIAALMLTLSTPGAAWACIPPMPLTAAEEEARDIQTQADLWARHDMVFAAVVTAVREDDARPRDPDASPTVRIHDTIRVQLEPIVMVKGDGPMPAPYEIRDIFVGCAPQGLQRAQVGQRYLIYGPPSSEFGRAGGIVEVDRLKDAETLVAVYQAATLLAIAP